MKYGNSYKLIKGIINCKIGANEKLVLFVLHFHRNEITKECYPSLNLIAKETGLSIKTVTRTLNNLKQIGLVVWTHDKNGRNNYLINEIGLESMVSKELKLITTMVKLTSGVGHGD